MCKCKFYNGDNCTYEDSATFQTEDGYCESDGEQINEDDDECDSFTEDYDDCEDEE